MLCLTVTLHNLKIKTAYMSDCKGIKMYSVILKMRNEEQGGTTGQ